MPRKSVGRGVLTAPAAAWGQAALPFMRRGIPVRDARRAAAGPEPLADQAVLLQCLDDLGGEGIRHHEREAHIVAQAGRMGAQLARLT